MENEQITMVRGSVTALVNEMHADGYDASDMLLDWYYEPSTDGVYHVDSGNRYDGDDSQAYEIAQTKGLKIINKKC